MNASRKIFVAFSSLCCLLVANNTCRAHFPWLTVDKEGHALMFFSENPAERDYKVPEAVTKADVLAIASQAKPAPISLSTVDTDKFKGRRSTEKVADGTTLATTFTYGNYRGTLLRYYAQHVLPVGAAPAKLPKTQELQATVAPAKTGMEVSVVWKGQPLSGAGVTIIDADGETYEDKTGKNGKVSFSTQAEGMTGFIIGHTIKAVEGEWEGEAYTSESHYCTVTTEYRKAVNGSSTKPDGSASKHPVSDSNHASLYAPLPVGVASFGAAVCEGSLYVYSGHTGKPHTHSRDNLSDHFHCLKLDGKSQWEPLAMQTPLQGLPLVTYAGKLFRIGGLLATNAVGEEDNLRSVDEFASFDPQTGEWTALPNLPNGRSSHDAVVLDGRLYVLGGWTLNGNDDGEWLEHGCVFDLTDASSSWQSIADLPFRRRALAVAHWNGNIIAMGGMTEDQEISVSVDCYNPATKEWSKLADFPSKTDEEHDYTMSGFGVSAWNTDGKLYASGSDGIVYRLKDDGNAWESVSELATPRFFHRLLASGNGELLIIGGAPLAHVEHLSDIEVVELR